MSKPFTISILLLVSTLASFGQSISQSDSLKIMASIDTIFRVLKTADFETFDKVSSKDIYCLPCFTYPNSKRPYMIDKKKFFKNHLSIIKQNDDFTRVTKSKDIIIQKPADDPYKRSDIIVLFTIYKRHELAPGHEGGQFGIYLKKFKNGYIFSGLETIP